jgi:hypothetical protein
VGEQAECSMIFPAVEGAHTSAKSEVVPNIIDPQCLL